MTITCCILYHGGYENACRLADRRNASKCLANIPENKRLEALWTPVRGYIALQ
jgi:hypothetical protein